MMPPGKAGYDARVDTPWRSVRLIRSRRLCGRDCCFAHSRRPGYSSKTKEVTTVCSRVYKYWPKAHFFNRWWRLAVIRNCQMLQPCNITLAVLPKKAGLLTFAQANGKLATILALFDGKDRQMLQSGFLGAPFFPALCLDKQGEQNCR